MNGLEELNTRGSIPYINKRERQLLVHSYIYYHANNNIIGDHLFDEWSKDLAGITVEFPENFSKSVYASDFKGFDGSSGAYLPYTMPDIARRAEWLINNKGV